MRGAAVAACTVLGLAVALPGRAEYADVVLDRRSTIEGVRPVVFPHWFHRLRYRCAVCHGTLGFRMQAGANLISMRDILDGRYCGACHNERIAWGPDRCDLCHTARPGTAAGVRGSHETRGPERW